MKNKLWILMALILVVATATTAFAAPRKKHPPISQQIADSIHQTSQAILRLKVRRVNTPNQPPITFAAKPKQN